MRGKAAAPPLHKGGNCGPPLPVAEEGGKKAPPRIQRSESRRKTTSSGASETSRMRRGESIRSLRGGFAAVGKREERRKPEAFSGHRKRNAAPWARLSCLSARTERHSRRSAKQSPRRLRRHPPLSKGGQGRGKAAAPPFTQGGQGRGKAAAPLYPKKGTRAAARNNPPGASRHPPLHKGGKEEGKRHPPLHKGGKGEEKRRHPPLHKGG